MSTQHRKGKSVLYVSLLLTIVFIVWGIFFKKSLTSVTNSIYDYTIDYLGWIYLASALFFVLFSVYLLFSKYGRIRIGKESDRPEFRTSSWLAMLFGAGMGIGIVYWSVAEPVTHYVTPPYGEGFTDASAKLAMQYTFFHWGFHPWAIYAVIGLSLAYFQYNKKLPASISSAFYPLLGDRIYGPIGKTIDILAVFATVFGIATSLGFGALQISGGFHTLFDTPNTLTVQVLIIAVATVLFLISISTGLEKGIQYLSNTAMILSFLIMLLVLILGPTFFIFNLFFNSLGNYLNDFLQMSLRSAPFSKGEWIGNWTLFYWAWWIAWAPFVGMFIARISKGRTIKEFILGVLVAPTLGTCFWIAIFGGTGLQLVHNLGDHALAKKIADNVSLSIFYLFDALPFSTLLSMIGLLVVITYYVTVADTSTFVLGMLSESGNLNPSNRIKITWGVIQSLVAIVLLTAGGLTVLQTVSIATALPFAIIMVFMCWSLVKGLRSEVKKKEKEKVKE
ncbi:BCCT family transporter [Fictibacillus halophilus]|uniref:glycine betaine uptake BCCT transporter n=1 Tax=Fictibacillus halophilus TaxID=1610490 RepID=UPI003624D3B6